MKDVKALAAWARGGLRWTNREREMGFRVKGRLLFVAGLGVGYVLGTRAGRERYEQIKRAAGKVWGTPAVQKGVDQVREFAMARVGDVSDTVLDGAKKLIRAATSQQADSGEALRKGAQRVADAAASVEDAAEAVAAEPAPKPAAEPAPKPKRAASSRKAEEK